MMPKKTTEFDPRGAKCEICGQHMMEADGCTLKFYLLADGPDAYGLPAKDQRIAPLKYGSEPEDWGAAEGKRCHDCGAKPGFPHHPGCDVERCPVCFRQAISCEEHLENVQMLVPKPKGAKQ